ncbi:hypothetical protein [Pararhizobium haloflavum]|uniref:hypothetical protein n=1 Tax=Pararhizobium haloflavum TaxID=2037914 RepID=UPI00130011BC|nr:hypothetical protein [Pararhizobium haloflavum]
MEREERREGPARHHANGPKERGYHHMRGHHRMMVGGAEFHLKAGRHDELHVKCGSADIETCVRGAQPLIDAMERKSRNERRGPGRDRDDD